MPDADLTWRFSRSSGPGGQHVNTTDTRVQLRFGDTVRTATRADAYGEIGGGIGLVLDSYGLLAVALDRGSASDELGLGAGDEVRLLRLEEEPGGLTTPVAFPTR